MVREREGGRKKEREGKEIVFKTVFANVCASAPLFLFFFSSDCEQVGEGGTCVYWLINMSLDLEIFGFRWVGLSRGMREAMIGIPCM